MTANPRTPQRRSTATASATSLPFRNLTTPPHGTFMHLSHMTCQLIVFSGQPNAHNGILQLARCLDVAPRLVKLHLDMVYLNLDDGGSDEVMEEEEVVNAQTKFGVDRSPMVVSYIHM
nr:uncharacterized protein LOC109781747 isoform X2 [Aegilops tauschii subsp. strangulata]